MRTTMTAKCPNCGSTNVAVFTADPTMGDRDTLDCNDCGQNYEYKNGTWGTR